MHAHMRHSIGVVLFATVAVCYFYIFYIVSVIDYITDQQIKIHTRNKNSNKQTNSMDDDDDNDDGPMVIIVEKRAWTIHSICDRQPRTIEFPYMEYYEETS